ncbi:MAG: penicillin-binding protein 1C [Hyphomicrobiaceae bacterium]
MRPALRHQLQAFACGTLRCLRRRPLVAAAVALAAMLPLGAWTTLEIAGRVAGPLDLSRADDHSVSVLDRNDRLLRAFTTSDGRWRLPATVDDVDPRYVAMLKSFEDRRFDTHHGIDWWALGRATVQLAGNGRIVSGGSTLTMQTARLLDGEHHRTAGGKLLQMARARQLEAGLSKSQILGLYLRLAPFGGNLEGVRAAALAYFGKEPRRLSIGEAALLVALPQAPELRRPDRNPEAARRARNRVLARAVENGVISAAEAERAATERVPTTRRDFPKLAPHLAEDQVARAKAKSVHRLTLDRDLQQSLEALIREHARALGPEVSAAILVADHKSGEILAHVASADYLDKSRLGPVDMVDAVRSPGSTLKPVIYGLAFEAGIAHPETLIEDRPARFGGYAPKNFDDDFHGTVTIRDALAQSLNIPAVKVLNAVGPGRMLGRFRRIGIGPVLPTRGEPTLAVALGGVGLRLFDLVQLYAALARGGEAVRLAHIREPKLIATARDRALPARRLMSEAAAWYVTDILKDAPPPAHARKGRLAYKTGTSYGYRDAWSIGYDGRHVVGVWVGRADGASVAGLTGRTAAAPLLFDVFQRIGPEREPLRAAPAGTLRVAAADLPPPLKRFAEPGSTELQGAFLEPAPQIAFPPDRADLEWGGEGEPLVLKAEHGALPLTWLIDGAPIGSEPHRRDVIWQPEGPGFARLTVIDAKGRADRVTVRVR